LQGSLPSSTTGRLSLLQEEADISERYFGMGATDDAVYPYLRETPKEGAVAVQNPEGAAKAQTEYQFTLVNATESTIAHWQKIGRQTLSNVRGLASFIQTTMISDLLLKEDADLLFANGTNGAVLGVFSAPLTDADIAVYCWKGPEYFGLFSCVIGKLWYIVIITFCKYEKWGIRKQTKSGRYRESDTCWGLHYTARPPFLIFVVISSLFFSQIINFKYGEIAN
jgi:hypothetical protein